MTEPEGAPTPATPPSAPATPPAAPAAAPPAAVSPPAPATPPPAAEPNWLQERLNRERRALLKDLGFKAPKDKDPKDLIAEAKAKLDGRKGKGRELKTKLEEAEGRVAALSSREQAWASFAAATLAELTAEDATLVKKLAGDDPAKQIDTVAELKASGRLSANPPASPTTPAAPTAPASPARVPAPANTTPAAPGPAPATPSNFDANVEYRRLLDNSKPGDFTDDARRRAFLLEHRDSLDFSKIVKT